MKRLERIVEEEKWVRGEAWKGEESTIKGGGWGEKKRKNDRG